MVGDLGIDAEACLRARMAESNLGRLDINAFFDQCRSVLQVVEGQTTEAGNLPGREPDIPAPV